MRLRFSLNVNFLKSKALMPTSPVMVQVQLQKIVPKITSSYLWTSQGTTLSCPEGKCKVTRKVVLRQHQVASEGFARQHDQMFP
jgi:hypothetical protein